MAFTFGGAGTSRVLGPCSSKKVSSPVDSEACVYRVVGGRVLNGQAQWMEVAQGERLSASCCTQDRCSRYSVGTLAGGHRSQL